MKIVMFSDSHGDTETMCDAVEKEKPDMVIYLGDGIADAEQLNEKYPNIRMIKVLGNVDSDKEDEEWIKFVEICGKRFIITHGHLFISYTYNSEFNDYRLTDEARMKLRGDVIKFMEKHNADVFLHGHTHEPYINRTQLMPGKTGWIMNPGIIKRKGSSIFNPVYGVLKFNENGTFEWQFIEVGFVSQ